MTEQPNVADWNIVYVIYSADVVSDRESFIEYMSPAQHSPRTADAFHQTEGDEQYGYDYLAREGAGDRYLSVADIAPDNEDESPNQGRHRKWVAELTREQWRMFADDYLIDLDENDMPSDYTDTLGSITEYGRLDAISVDMREGWYGPGDGNASVIDANAYLSFGIAE